MPRSISTGGGHVEYTPIGHTTNLASRMQALAPTGSIAISEQTRNLVEGYFALKPLGPTKVKGVNEPVNVYEVTGLGPAVAVGKPFGRRQREVRHALTGWKSPHLGSSAQIADYRYAVYCHCSSSCARFPSSGRAFVSLRKWRDVERDRGEHEQDARRRAGQRCCLWPDHGVVQRRRPD